MFTFVLQRRKASIIVPFNKLLKRRNPHYAILAVKELQEVNAHPTMYSQGRPPHDKRQCWPDDPSEQDIAAR